MDDKSIYRMILRSMALEIGQPILCMVIQKIHNAREEKFRLQGDLSVR